MNMKRMFLFLTIVMTLAFFVGCTPAEEAPETTEKLPEETTLQTEVTTASTEHIGAVSVGESDEEAIDGDETQSMNEATKPAEKTDETTKPTEKPDSETTEPTTQATQPEETTKPQQGANTGVCCEYGQYLKLSPAEQQAYMESFPSPVDFIAWAQQAEAEHEGHKSDIVVEGGDINIGDYMG